MPKNPSRNKVKSRSSAAPRSAANLLATLVRRDNPGSGGAKTPGNPDDLCESLKSLLPPELGARLLAARLRDGELVLFADSAAWAGRLKLAATELIAAGRMPAALPPGTRVLTRLMPGAGFRR